MPRTAWCLRRSWVEQTHTEYPDFLQWSTHSSRKSTKDHSEHLPHSGVGLPTTSALCVLPFLLARSAFLSHCSSLGTPTLPSETTAPCGGQVTTGARTRLFLGKALLKCLEKNSCLRTSFGGTQRTSIPQREQPWSRGGEKSPEDKCALRSWVPLQRRKALPASGK